jgi:uncharacterized protein
MARRSAKQGTAYCGFEAPRLVSRGKRWAVGFARSRKASLAATGLVVVLAGQALPLRGWVVVLAGQALPLPGRCILCSVSSPIKLSKSDTRRAFVRHHFSSCASQQDAFERLRSIQFDPIAPVGCNHDLVLQARVPGYKVGDWQKLAYEDRHIYDGWDKMASLVPFEGWPLRRIFYKLHRRGFEEKIFRDHKDAVDAVLKEITERGPLLPKHFEFQARKEEWKGSWFGPSVTKQTLRALWHSGMVMTAGRKNGQHLYDLTDRVVPDHVRNQPIVEDVDAQRELVLERHVAMGIVRPTAPP